MIETKATNDYNVFKKTSWEILGFDPEIAESEFKSSSEPQLLEMFQNQFLDFYHQKSERVIQHLLPICEQVYANEGHRYTRIAVPFTDGRLRTLGIGADLKQAVETKGKSIWNDIEKQVTLSIIDDEWKEQLRNMDELKESVQGASFEQKDPLVIYKVEAYALFEDFVGKINREVTSYLSKGMLVIQQEQPAASIRQAPPKQRLNLRNQVTNQDLERREAERQSMREAAAAAGREPQRQMTVVKTDPRIGRNDPCPCGSGKKYKNCHGTGA